MAAVAAPARPTGDTPAPWIRGAVREVLEKTPNYRQLAAPDRQALAQAMVRVSALAAELVAEEDAAARDIPPNRAPLSRAQAQPSFAAADRIADTTRNVLGAVSFPRFVTELINGVFKAMIDSSTQQMQSYVQLLNSVSASAAGFEQTQFGLSQVRQWVADHFPDNIEYDLPEQDPGEEPDPEETADIRLRLRPGASMPDPEQVRAALGMEPGESLDAGNPEQLVPLARRHLARQRQQMLATMVMMGMQRIVIDSGKINAAMRFHVDTRSAANTDRGSQFSLHNRVKAGANAMFGPWGASAEIENTIGYVSTERSQSTEEMNTELDLNSSVELNFRSDYLPLNRMAAQAQADRIRNASLNPVAEADPAEARNRRLETQVGAERERRGGINTAIDSAAPMQESAPLRIPEPQQGAASPPATGAPAADATPATDAAPAADAPAADATPATDAAPAADAPAQPPAGSG